MSWLFCLAMLNAVVAAAGIYSGHWWLIGWGVYWGAMCILLDYLNGGGG